jgi:hypothetical protein
MLVLGIILIVLAIGIFIGSINIAAEEGEVSYFIIGTIITLAFILGGIASIRYDNYRANEEFRFAIEHQKYEQIRTFVEGIYKDKFDTKDGTFNVTEYSKFTDVLSLKVDQVVTITYVHEEYGLNHIIDIMAEPIVSK